MRLIPVVEFDAGYYNKQDHQVESYDDPGWSQRYWKTCLADVGITNLQSFHESWHVLLEDIDHDTLVKMLPEHFTDDIASEAVDKDHVSSLEGGYVLDWAGKFPYIWPNCCGSLENISGWQEACDWRSGDEYELWIGHPWLLVRSVDEGHLHIRYAEEYGDDEPFKIVVQRQELSDAIKQVRTRLLRFQVKLVLALEALGVDDAVQIADILVHGAESSHWRDQPLPYE